MSEIEKIKESLASIIQQANSLNKQINSLSNTLVTPTYGKLSSDRKSAVRYSPFTPTYSQVRTPGLTSAFSSSYNNTGSTIPTTISSAIPTTFSPSLPTSSTLVTPFSFSSSSIAKDIKTLNSSNASSAKLNWCALPVNGRDPTDVLGTYRYSDLSKEEKKIFNQVKPVVKRWGYRQGVDEEHIGFEKEMHDKDFYAATDATDPLFRTLQQGVARNTDYKTKLLNALQSYDTWATSTEWHNVAKRFLEDKATNDQIRYLARLNPQKQDYSAWIVALIIAAKQIVFAAQEDIETRKVGKAWLQSYSQCIKDVENSLKTK